MKNKKPTLQQPTLEEQVSIYNSLLISLHTARWTHNHEQFAEIMDKIGAYSYARTNSNGYEEEEKEQQLRTLLNLKR